MSRRRVMNFKIAAPVRCSITKDTLHTRSGIEYMLFQDGMDVDFELSCYG